MAAKEPEAIANIHFSSTRHPHPALPWYRERFVWLLIAIPAVAVMSGITMLILALSSDDGLVADDYYRRGMEINLELNRDRAAQKRQVSATLDIHTNKTFEMNLQQGSDGTSEQAPAQLELQLLHATRDGYDRILLLPRGHDGRYRGAVLDLDPGKYHVQAAAGDWRIAGTLLYPGNTSIHLEPAIQ